MTQEPVPEPRPEQVPPPVQEVEAQPISRFETPAPTIDVEAQRPPPPSAPPPPPPAPAKPRRDRHLWSVFSHLLLFLVMPTIFLGGVITFFVWQLFGKHDTHLEDQGREALNFQLNVAIVTALMAISCFAFPLIPLAWFVAGILCLIAAKRASEGELYRYPYIVRIVKH